MEKIYSQNGLVFRSEEEINLRDRFALTIKENLEVFLKKINSGFEFRRCEATILTPNELINPNYTEDDVFMVDDLTLRPETTMGSYEYASHILNPHLKPKTRLPLVVRQHGKSFRREQDKTLSNMRLKEFYQLEFQIIYSESTDFDYYPVIVPFLDNLIASLVGDTYLEQSDRLPSYSEVTTDVVMRINDMEVCSISKRNDFDGAKVIEIAIGTDRLVHNFFNMLK